MKVAVGAHMWCAEQVVLPSPPPAPPPPQMHISTSGWSSLACSTQAAQSCQKERESYPLAFVPPYKQRFSIRLWRNSWSMIVIITINITKVFCCKFFLWTPAVQETKQSAYTKYNYLIKVDCHKPCPIS